VIQDNVSCCYAAVPVTYARRVLGVVAVAGLATLSLAHVSWSRSADAAAVDAAELSSEGMEVAVDARVELFSVLERLAGRPEYGVAATPYALAVDAWFAPYAGEPAVASFRRLRESHSIGYDAAMTLAAQLDEQLAPVRPLSPLPEGLDVRWEASTRRRRPDARTADRGVPRPRVRPRPRQLRGAGAHRGLRRSGAADRCCGTSDGAAALSDAPHRRRGVDCQSARGALPPRRGRYRRRPPVTRDATSTRVHLDPRSGPDARDCDRGG
jgi:Domain of unknown function (DUF4932)